MTPGSQPIKVLVIDDSAVVRQAMQLLLADNPRFAVQVAADPLIAQHKLERERPDVIVLDLELPRMDGLTFLAHLMATDPMPVVVCSSLVGPGAEAGIRALESGAVELIAKPRVGVRAFLEESRELLIDAIEGACRARVRKRPPPRAGSSSDSTPRSSAASPPSVRALNITTDRVLAIGASTGGTEALALILQAMPAGSPGIVVVQHMPERFTAAFAGRLDALCAIEVREATHGDAIRNGLALIAPGNRHLRVVRTGGHYAVCVEDGPLVSRHRPSVDVLFTSVAQACGRNAVGAILTGMGADGASGLLAMRQAGAATLAQDEASCVVYGMPKEAVALGAVQQIVALKDVPAMLLTLAERDSTR